MDDIITKINTAIRFSFYFLFFITPLVMFPTTYELFEFNKMWIVFGVSVLIAFLWISKMIFQGKFEIRRTPLDIPIALFFISQLVSTMFSLDSHVSFWGYYSRFNGGLLSTISYLFLYYAFATNLINEEDENEKPVSYKILLVSLLSGFAVVLWGIPSHFGFDPTCLVFRGTLDVSCWTEAFQPKIRIFSTLGQPNWLGTFVATLIPVTLGFGIYKLRETQKMLYPSLLLGLSFLFFLALLYTRSQSSFLGLGIGMVVFFALVIFSFLKRSNSNFKSLLKQKPTRFLIISVVIFALTLFLVGTPIEKVNKFTTLSGITTLLQAKPEPQKPASNSSTEESFSANPNIELGGTESSKIRLIVWQGALDIFRNNPLFGTGVETYAYAYYKVKPVAHNLTSEWDYLYNKAHNEYLNYLATTGIFGLGTYLLIIGMFLFIAFKKTLSTSYDNQNLVLYAGIIGGFTAILVSNFFGFSVVIVNLYFFFLPLFFFDLEKNKKLKQFLTIPASKKGDYSFSNTPVKTIAVIILALVAIYYELYLLNFWNADKKYALGYNLNKAGEYVQAYTPLNEAVQMLPNEDLYKDELSINMATLAILLSEQGEATQAAQFANQAKALSDEVVSKHPNNVVFLKTRARVAFALAQLDPQYINLATQTLHDAQKLAPTDAKLSYNLALFYNQVNDYDNTVKYLDEATKLKPNYLDAYYAKAVLYGQLAKDEPTKASEYTQKQKAALEYILKNIDPKHPASLEMLKSLE